MPITTPEGVTFELTLAGLGSRFIAAVVDFLLQITLALAVFALAWLAGSGVVAAIAIAAAFGVFFGYDIAFETLAGGRTPGKRWTGLRVVRQGGAPVGFFTSAVRNLLRLVDILPAFYLFGMVSLLVTRHNQRLGDVVAGTLVVRERTENVGRPWIPDTLADHEELALWDVSAVTAAEAATVRQFLERRHTLTREARARLARELAVRLRPKVAGPGEDVTSEEFLEQLLAAKATRG